MVHLLSMTPHRSKRNRLFVAYYSSISSDLAVNFLNIFTDRGLNLSQIVLLYCLVSSIRISGKGCHFGSYDAFGTHA